MGFWENRQQSSNQRLILHNSQDGEPLPRQSAHLTYFLTKRSHRLVGGALVIFAVPIIAGAAFFDGLASTYHYDASRMHEGANVQTLALLEGARNSDPHVAIGGGDIAIEDREALAALAPETTVTGEVAGASVYRPESGEISIYTVREGDTLSQIAQMFNVSINTIRWSNDLSVKDAITPGQTLTILPISGVRHTVEKGDTLKSLAKKYSGDIDEIRNFNGLAANTTLSVGDIVVIPGGEIHVAAPKQAPRSSGASVGPSAGGPVYAGYYMRPITGGVRTQGIHGYNGVDLASSYGAPIMAAASGQVIVSKSGGWNGGYGNYVVIKHDNGTQTLYAHASQNIVSVGQWVEQGQVIAYMGSTGRSTGTHLHFEVRGAANPF